MIGKSIELRCDIPFFLKMTRSISFSLSYIVIRCLVFLFVFLFFYLPYDSIKKYAE